MEKYSDKGPFTDPVVRCHECKKLIRMEKLKETGKCPCGSRRVDKVKGFSLEERQKMESWGIDPDYLTLLGEVPDAE